MPRLNLVCGGLFLALGLLSLTEALRIRDAWQGARLMPAALGVTLVALGIGHLLPSMAGPIAGKIVRGLAVVHPTRLPGLPEVPTAREAGFPDLDVVGWQGLSGPPKLPAPIVATWAGLRDEASKDPGFLEQTLTVNKVTAFKGPEAFWQFQQEEQDVSPTGRHDGHSHVARRSLTTCRG